MNNNINVIFTRFSIFNKHASSAWRLARIESKEEALAKLLDENRLKIRCDIFFNFSLPAIERAVKNGHNIRHLVMHYDKLPGWVLDLFDEASAKYSWFKSAAVAYDDELDMYGQIKDCVRNEDFEANQLIPYAGIRLDDDDILGCKYFDKLSNYLNKSFFGFAISFPKGVAGLWNKGYEKYSIFKEDKNAQGISQINLYDTSNNKFLSPYLLIPGMHPIVDEHVPTILDSTGDPVYVRSFHDNNDVMHGRDENQVNNYINKTFRDEIEYSIENDL
jgi:hypothetical protein